MVGGASRRDDGPLGINRSNGFAALESLRRKKKSDKSSSKNKGSKTPAKEAEPQVFWAPAPLTVKSWADVDDDDDYYATTAPPQSVWGAPEQQQTKDTSSVAEARAFLVFTFTLYLTCCGFSVESETEDDMLDEGDDIDEDEHEHEHEHDVPPPVEPEVKKPLQPAVAPKETERQLSKKELKKKELAELDAVLAELGLNKPSEKEESQGGEVEKKGEEVNGTAEKKEGCSTQAESKSAKKKKAKKEKAAKEAKDPQEQMNGSHVDDPEEVAENEQAEEGTPQIDMKERLKKVASSKKKKSGKELDGAAKAAAIEAAARSAKLAAAKKKEKAHYNQQPVR
ncbi:hypothetical protein EJ110_NYTH43654 [Nymphaea thermarum]|nr:hypothetical protein EJ110_NYTH43654 [Nymphaea thermarum]